MTTVTQVAEAMQTVLSSVADRVGRTSGFVHRASKVGGAAFVQTLVFGWLANAEATLEELSQTAATLGVSITPQGLDQRFTAEAAACLRAVLARAVETLLSADAVVLPVLDRFSGVYVLDSTTVSLPSALADIWAGGGGSGGEPTAALKLSVQLEWRTGRLSGPDLQAGRSHDQAAPLQTASLPVGALRLADLGYFDLDVLAAMDQQGVVWLSRLKGGTLLYDTATQPIDLPTRLAEPTLTELDLPIQLGATHRLACRLLARRVPPAVATQRRRQLQASARHKQQPLSQARLALADWTLLITNVPTQQLSVAEALSLVRVRWQIELLFKLWKSHGQLAVSRSAKPMRILCEVYAKLLAMLVQHWVMLVSCWAYPDRSLLKAAQTMRKHAFHLAVSFGCIERLSLALGVVQRCLAHGCRINKRRTSPPTYQRLLAVTQTALA